MNSLIQEFDSFDSYEEHDDEYFKEIHECDYCGDITGNCICDESACCFQLGYIGLAGSCHCRDHQIEFERSQHWFWKIWDVSYYEHWRRIRYSNPLFKTKRYLLDKTKCDECNETTYSRNWKELKCPNCGADNLPF